MEKKYKILVAKVGLDGHDRGAKLIARILKDAGVDVLYTGLHKSAKNVARIAVEEDVDAIGLSILSGAHMTAFSDLIEELKKEDSFDDITVFGGGIIPDEDITLLKNIGVKQIFSPGAKSSEIINWIAKNIEPKRVG